MKLADQHMLQRLQTRVELLERAERHWPSTNRYHEMRCLQQQIERLKSGDPYQTPPRRSTLDDQHTCQVAWSDDRSYNQRMFTILRNGTPVINADDLQTAIRFVQSLESSIDRSTQHSPYTIVPADHTRPQPEAHVSKSDFNATCWVAWSDQIDYNNILTTTHTRSNIWKNNLAALVTITNC